MNRKYATRVAAWRLMLAGLVTLGAAAACAPGDSGGSEGTDGEPAAGGRLTTSGAGDLLSRGFTPSEAQSRGLKALNRPADGPPIEEVTIDSLGVNFGLAEAPLRMIEFFDYGCGYCRRFHEETRTLLHEQYVDEGHVYWKSLPFIIGRWPASVPVTLAAECARDQGQDYFEAISGVIFEHQSDWKGADSPEELAEEYAAEAGLDMNRFRTCFANDEFLWRVQAQTAFAGNLGVRGTPTFLLVGFGPIQGALPLETFQQVIDTMLVEVTAQQP